MKTTGSAILDLPVDALYSIVSDLLLHTSRLSVGQEIPDWIWERNTRYIQRIQTRRGLLIHEQCKSDLKEFYSDFMKDRDSFEVVLAKRSPRMACNYAIKSKQSRLCPDAEAILAEKKNPSKQKEYVRYCTHFDIIAKNIDQITLEAAYGSSTAVGNKENKEYIKKIKEAKSHCKELISQVMNQDNIPDTITVKELMEILG